MVSFLEENGYPMTVHVETKEDVSPENGVGIYESKITDDAGNVLKTFSHSDLRARIHFVDGFFTALRLVHGV